MVHRVLNFYPGPATLPLQALEKAKDELLDYQGTGMSIMETSHRSAAYSAVHQEAGQLVRELLELPDNYHVLFLQGGASLQFAMIPTNLLANGASADYVITGSWAKKAVKEAKIIGQAHVAGTSEEANFTYIPKDLDLSSDAAYVHITSNNTISGTQYRAFPDTGSVPLVADMSSDFLWRKFDVAPFGLMYAGAQKNLGPAGVTLVVIRDDLLAKCRDDIPTLLKYKTHVDKDSLFNTGPCFAIYMVRNVLQWVKAQGGLAAMEARNNEKGDLLYGLIEEMSEFFRCPVAKEDRSVMNVVFRLPTEELEKRVIQEAQDAGFIGLKGHRSVGGMRVSMYNAMEPAGVKALVDFLRDFAIRNG
jgi:phosphoserine aminotransferase